MKNSLKRIALVVLAASSLSSLYAAKHQANSVTILDVIAAEPQLKAFNNVLLSSEVAATLKEDGKFTVFAPSNQAVMQAQAQGKNINASYHVIRGKKALSLDDLEDRRTAHTLAHRADSKKEWVRFSQANGQQMVNNAYIITSFQAGNGIVYLIDNVLSPDNKGAQAKKSAVSKNNNSQSNVSERRNRKASHKKYTKQSSELPAGSMMEAYAENDVLEAY